ADGGRPAGTVQVPTPVGVDDPRALGGDRRRKGARHDPWEHVAHGALRDPSGRGPPACPPAACPARLGGGGSPRPSPVPARHRPRSARRRTGPRGRASSYLVRVPVGSSSSALVRDSPVVGPSVSPSSDD